MIVPRTLRRLAATAVSVVAIVACGGADINTTGSSTPGTVESVATVPTSTAPTVPPSTAATTEPPTVTERVETSTYTIQAGDSLFGIAEANGVSLDALVEANGWPDGAAHLILPGDEIVLPAPGAESDDGSGDAASAGGYADADATLPFDGDRTAPVGEPLADGVYFSDEYTSDGTTVTFSLSQYFLCDSGTNVPDEPSIACASGFGTLDEPTATVELARDADVTVATGDLDDPTRSSVSAAEFVRLVAGEQPAADAPSGYQFADFLVFVEVVDGAAVGVQQFYTS